MSGNIWMFCYKLKLSVPQQRRHKINRCRNKDWEKRLKMECDFQLFVTFHSIEGPLPVNFPVY
ncbi:hypothetical protein I79_001064 [Cricetulus griseus]|uniref:Uncharacterized protein n=1 Tax=Cricetulus griseus TaxID=10029 RepID=G3GTS5_CRIGR|nr:hypothetical protein I79_001064 [Cricetulus griseus]